MRQAGMLAAGGIYALEHNIRRLAEDHANAALLARGLSEIEELDVDFAPEQTNMVFIRAHERADRLPAFLKQRGILVLGGEIIRLVTHLDVSEEDILTAISAFKEFFSKSGA